MGWARANILYDRIKRLPEAGSPMEIVFLVIWRMRQQIEFHKSRVLVQALLNQQGAEAKHIESAYEDLRGAFFPFEKTQREDEIVDLKKVMHRELAKGALSVTPMMDMTRANIKQKLSKGEAAIRERASLLKSGRLRALDGEDRFRRAKMRIRETASLTKVGNAKDLARLSQITTLPIA